MRFAIVHTNKGVGPFKHVAYEAIRVNGRPSVTVLDVTTIEGLFEAKYFEHYLANPREFFGKDDEDAE